MTRRETGFTLVELMIVVAVIVIIMAIAVPSLLAARVQANETAALAVMRSICTAQAQFSQAGAADEDHDSIGEYGVLGELSGLVGVRGGTGKTPTDLSASMRRLNGSGEVEKSGYLFRLYLPDSSGLGVSEAAAGGIGPGVTSPDLSEGYWCCYAWPQRHGTTGRRTFYVSAGADIIFTDAKDYSGPACAAIHAGNALQTGNVDSMTGTVAVGTIGADGNLWRAAN
jgi:prepilin-type N-terminal cleavage/methylation domain-containing protein